MAGNIKGITIEFDGKTTGLESALFKVRKEAKDTSKELGIIRNSLKFNPKNVDLWKQKQKVLNDAIKQTDKNLEELKREQKKLDSQGIDQQSEEYRDLERQILRCEGQLKNYKKEVSQIPSAEIRASAEALKEVGGKMQTVGKTMTKYVTAPIVAGSALAIKAFNEVDEGIDEIAKKTGATGDELEGMSKILKDITTSMPTDFATAGKAIGEVSTRFEVAGEQLQDLSTLFLQFAELNSVDVVTAIDQTQKALSAYGLGAEDAGAYLDRMNKVAQETGVSVDTLQQGIVTNASAFQEMGLNIDQATIFMGKLEKSGVKSETVLGGLRKAFNKATKEGKPFNEALAELEENIKNGGESMESMQQAQDLFGKSWQDIYRAIQDGTLTFEDLAGAVEDAGGSVSNTFAETQDPADKFQQVMNNVKVTGMELAETVMPLLSEGLEKLNNFITQAREKWAGLDDGQKKMILSVVGIVAVLGPLLMGIGSIITMVGNLMIFAPMIMGALSGMIVPILAVIAVIAGLVSAGVLLYKNWDTIKAKAQELVENVQRKFAEMKSKVETKVQGMISTVRAKWESLKTSAGQTFESIKNKITEPIETAKEKVKSAIEFIKGLFPISVGKIFSGLKLPHFSLSWGTKSFGKLGSIDYPTGLNVDWHAKGGIFTRPTLFPTAGGYAGVGEAGAEAVLPLDLLWENMNRMADSIVNGVVAGVRMSATGGDVIIPVYLYPSGQKMDEIIVRAYDRGKERLG